MASGQIRLVDSLENLSRPALLGITVEVERVSESTLVQPFPDAQRLESEFNQRGLTSELRRDGSLWVAGIDQQNCRLVWEAARHCGVRIKQLSSPKNSLEEVFFQAVQEARHALA
jgi:hypothetical protein